MLKIFKAQFIIFLAVCFLVSLSVVYANNDIANLGVEKNSMVEKWRLLVGKENVRYGTKYTILLNGEKHEYYLKYKEIVPQNKSLVDAKFKGYYWGMKSKYQDIEKDEKYIYKEIEISRKDVIEFLEIKDEKLAALIKEGYEFSLYVEPYYNYKKEKWGEFNTSTLRELYAMLPEANGKITPYQNARDENGNILKSKVHGIEFLREIIVKAMNSIESKNIEKHKSFSNEYKNVIQDEMLNKGFASYYFEEEIKTGEFLKLIVVTMWPEYKYAKPEDGIHPNKPYANALDRKILMTADYDFARLEKIITRKEAARLLCLFYINYKEGYELDDKYEYIQSFKDEKLVTQKIERVCIDDVIRFGLMSGYNDGTFRPNNALTTREALEIFKKAISEN